VNFFRYASNRLSPSSSGKPKIEGYLSQRTLNSRTTSRVSMQSLGTINSRTRPSAATQSPSGGNTAPSGCIAIAVTANSRWNHHRNRSEVKEPLPPPAYTTEEPLPPPLHCFFLFLLYLYQRIPFPHFVLSRRLQSRRGRNQGRRVKTDEGWTEAKQRPRRLVERIESKKERRKVCTRENKGRGKDGTTTRVGEMGKAMRSYQERPNNAPGQSVGCDRQKDPEKDYTRGEDKREERRQRDEEQCAEVGSRARFNLLIMTWRRRGAEDNRAFNVHNRYLSRYFVNNFHLSLACCDSYHQVFSLHSAFSPFPSLYHSGRDKVRCLMKAREKQRGWWSFGLLDELPRCNSTISVSKHKNVNLSRRVIRARGGKKGTERRERAALIICTRTSLLSCGRRTRPLQLWHSALPRLQPSCSTRIPFESGYSTNRLHPSRISNSLPLPLSTHLFFFPYHSLARSLAHFSTDIARVPFHSEKFNYNPGGDDGNGKLLGGIKVQVLKRLEHDARSFCASRMTKYHASSLRLYLLVSFCLAAKKCTRVFITIFKK
ncbi:hypothetical protein ALC53_09287, partial [Atta colombica]